jgi:UDP-galactopyranose mutase
VLGYTRRQWGLDPRCLDASWANRVRINGYDERLLTPRHRFQGLPAQGYAGFMESILAGIPHLLNVDYLQCRSEYIARKAIVFTGPIDEFFGFSEGRLAYRGQIRTHEFLPHVDYCQPCAQVNLPEATDAGPIRRIEWKHLMPQATRATCHGTVLTREFPFTPENPNQFEYPLPMEAQRRHYEEYRRRAARVSNLMICGRLGEYRYMDMDHAIGRALLLAEKLCAARQVRLD